MPIVIFDSKLLIVGGQLALSEDCCCGETPPPPEFQDCEVLTANADASSVGAPSTTISYTIPTAVDLTIGSAANAFELMCREADAAPSVWKCNELQATHSLVMGEPTLGPGSSPCTWYKPFLFCCESNVTEESYLYAHVVKHSGVYKWRVAINLFDNGPPAGGCRTNAAIQQLAFLSTSSLTLVGSDYYAHGSWGMTKTYDSGDPGFGFGWCSPFDSLTLVVTP